MHLKIFILKFN